MSRIKIERGISYDQARDRYYVYMDGGLDEEGRRIRQYKTYPTLTLARRSQRAFQGEREAARAVTPTAMTLDNWLDYWMENVVCPGRAETTIYCYRKIIENHVSPALGNIPLQHLTPQAIQQYYSSVLHSKGLSPNTVRRHHDLLSAALHTAVRQDLLLRSPTDRVEPPRAVPHEARFYSPENLKRLYELSAGTALEVPVRLAGGLGLRREEICGLKWSCVDFAQRRVHICAARTAAGAKIVEKETKNRSSTRALYMDDDLCALLRRTADRQAADRQAAGNRYRDTGLVLVNKWGVPWSPNGLSLCFTRFIRRSRLPPLTLHGLRHTFATVASAQGAPLFEIGRALGHSTPATTGRIYTHLLDQTHEATLLRVSNALRSC